MLRGYCSRVTRGIGRSTRALASRDLSIGRRKRPGYEQYPEEHNFIFDPFTGLKEPFKPREKDVDGYLEKVSLSPWVPVPEAACRKYFDLAEVQPGDVHVDLGSGDGRVCFYAADYVAGVEKSTGIDVDAEILQVALDRLAKRHPKPPNLEFVLADLMDPEHDVWATIQEATIITMFFQEDALRRFRPLLEQKLMGKKCRIITAGYAMPTSWVPYSSEVVLGTHIYLYKWGYDAEETPNYSLFQDNILEGIDLPEELRSPIEQDDDERFKDMKIIDHSAKARTMEEIIAQHDRDSAEEDGELFTEDEEREAREMGRTLEPVGNHPFLEPEEGRSSTTRPILNPLWTRSARGLRELAKEEKKEVEVVDA